MLLKMRSSDRYSSDELNLSSLNWNMEKAVEEHLLDNTDSLSTSSSGSDFVVIDRNSLSDKELIGRLVNAPMIIYDMDWNAAIASLPDDDTSESDDSCEVISISEGISAVSHANGKANIDGDEHFDSKVSFVLGSSPISEVTDYVKQKNDKH
ncbi:unnamed protein product [Onchocerca flexuosa]|uniref:Ovule protein n=2 Tax=Onchocerca flexuosa TaxID=387005 RepID=A0A183H7T0_9BILA|nr:unnamed protein product [Onchocerca flexuosa]